MLHKIKLLLEMIKFEHTIFALPFAFTGAFLAARGMPSLMQCFWIGIAMAGARTSAMAFNRLVDMPFDAQNPRTSQRELPSGKVSKKDTYLLIIASSSAYFLAAAMLNPLALMLSPIFLAIVLAYSYTKRFTWLCHIFLGLAIGLAPFSGWIAVSGAFSWQALLLTFGVCLWVAGFDILYASQDVDFDREVGLRSIPARFGVRNAFWLSAVLHCLAFVVFVAVGFAFRLTAPYFAGLLLTAAFFVMQRVVIKPDDMSRLNLAFFTLNGAVSLVVFIFTAIALWWEA